MPLVTGKGRGISGFTLPNMLVSTSIFIMLIGGVVASHLFGLKLSEISRTILGATESNPIFAQTFFLDMHQVKKVMIGHGSHASFAEVSSSGPQIGSALQIQTGDDPDVYIRYFVDPSDHLLKRMTQESGSLETVTGFLIGTNVFSAQDFLGNTLTNKQGVAVIALDMDYSSMYGSGVVYGTNHYFDSYRYSMKYTPRTSH